MSKLEYRILPVTPFQQNCTLVWDADTGKGAFVDAGGDIDQLMALAEQQGVEIEKLLVTHGHLDHVGGVAEMLSTFNVPVEGPHIADKFWIDALSEQCKMFGFEHVEAFTPDRWLNDGDKVIISALDYPVDGMKLALAKDKKDTIEKENSESEISSQVSKAQVVSNDSKGE